MGRLARLVFPGPPHHVTQRGNGRAQTFFEDADYTLYRELLAASCRAGNVEIWSCVLMPNHVHLILSPADADGIRRALAPVHRRYAGAIHARLKRTGHFWQGRFGAVAMDEAHLAAAVRYVALNPVRARLVEQAGDWPWSSARSHLTGIDDGVTALSPLLNRFPRFAAFIATETDPDMLSRLRRAERVGRLWESDVFVENLEGVTVRMGQTRIRTSQGESQIGLLCQGVSTVLLCPGRDASKLGWANLLAAERKRAAAVPGHPEDPSGISCPEPPVKTRLSTTIRGCGNRGLNTQCLNPRYREIPYELRTDTPPDSPGRLRLAGSRHPGANPPQCRFRRP